MGTGNGRATVHGNVRGKAITHDLVTSAAAAIARTPATPAEQAMRAGGFAPTNWLGFSGIYSEPPTRAWQAAHDALYTNHGILRHAAMTPANRPVPRHADHHYAFPLASGGGTVYLY